MERLYFCNGKMAVPAADGALPGEGFIWLDFLHEEVNQVAAEVQRLTGVHIFDDHIIDAGNLSHPSFFDNTDKYEMVIFRGLAPKAKDTRIVTRPMTIFNFERALVTVRAPDSRSVAQVKGRCTQQAVRQPRSPDELMHRLLSAMVDYYLELRQPLTERLEYWQRELLDPRNPFDEWLLLLEQRNDLRRLEDLCEEQHDAIQEWRDYRLQDISAELQVRFNDLIEHITRVLTHVRRVEATIESAVQLHFAAVAYRTSEIMRALTLITAIFMPLTLITGVYGMNFEMIPGLHSRYGFYASLAVMLGVLVGMLWLFRRRGWL